MRIVPDRSDAFLEINHSIKAKDYVDFKFKSLQRLCKTAPIQRKSNGTRIAYRFYTKQHRELTEIFRQFYKNGSKTIPKGLSITPRVLAIWYMDDGSKCRDSDIYLNSQQFPIADQKFLLRKLSEIGIRARLNKDKKYYRIRIYKESVKDFMNIVSPYVVESMTYKLVMTP